MTLFAVISLIDPHARRYGCNVLTPPSLCINIMICYCTVYILSVSVQWEFDGGETYFKFYFWLWCFILIQVMIEFVWRSFRVCDQLLPEIRSLEGQLQTWKKSNTFPDKLATSKKWTWRNYSLQPLLQPWPAPLCVTEPPAVLCVCSIIHCHCDMISFLFFTAAPSSSFFLSDFDALRSKSAVDYWYRY